MKFLNLLLFIIISTIFLLSGCDKDDPVSPEETVNLPTVVTADINDITYHTAIGGGEVTDDGGSEVTARGVVWCTSYMPTLENDKTDDGSGTGSFTSDITDLQSGATYYVRAYAMNSEGTAYGDQVDFRTIQETGTVTDIDGNEYETVKIGDQWWIAENLLTTRYRNGDDILTGLIDAEWRETTSGAYTIYPHDEVDGINSDAEMVDAYGKLYNWYAVDDDRGLCPEGWHVPSDEEWKQLEMHLGMTREEADRSHGRGNPSEWRGVDEGGKLKSTRTEPDAHPRWREPNRGATNESGFLGLPGGNFHPDWHMVLGVKYHGIYGTWWSSSSYGPYLAWDRIVGGNYITVGRTTGTSKRFGRSVRCIMYEQQTICVSGLKVFSSDRCRS